jgi:hypothetical protein
MQTLTPVDTFTSPVQGVSNSDPPTATNINTAPQALTNRTEWLGNRTGWIAQGSFGTDSGLVVNDFLSIASVEDLTSKGFVEVAPDKIKVPAPGGYEVHFNTITLSSSTADNVRHGVSIYVEGASQQPFRGQRGSTSLSDEIYVSGSFFVTIADEDTERIKFRLSTVSAGTVSVQSSSRWMIKRVA